MWKNVITVADWLNELIFVRWILMFIFTIKSLKWYVTHKHTHSLTSIHPYILSFLFVFCLLLSISIKKLFINYKRIVFVLSANEVHFVSYRNDFYYVRGLQTITVKMWLMQSSYFQLAWAIIFWIQTNCVINQRVVLEWETTRWQISPRKQ